MLLFSPEYIFPKSISIALIVVLLANLALFAAIFHVEQANAQFTDVAAMAQRVAKFIWDAAKWVWEKAVQAQQAAWRVWDQFKSSHGTIAEIISSLLLVMMHQVLAKITNDIVAWINGGGKGQIRVLQDPGGFLLDALDEAGGVVAGAILNVDADTLCDASYLKFTLTAAFTGPYAVPTFDEKVACTFTGAAEGLQKFQEDFTSGGWASFIELSRKENNQLGHTLITAEEMARIKSEKSAESVAKLNISKGFLAQEKCTITKAARWSLSDDVTGQDEEISTDALVGKTLEEAQEKMLATDPDVVGMEDIGTFKQYWISLGGEVACKTVTPAEQISELASKALQAPMKRLEDSIIGLTSKLGTGAGSVIKPYVLAIASAGLNLLVNKGIGLITNELAKAKKTSKAKRQPTASLQENTVLAQSTGALTGSVKDFRSFLLKALVEFSMFTTNAVTALANMDVLGRTPINRAEAELRGGVWYLGGYSPSKDSSTATTPDTTTDCGTLEDSCGACPAEYASDYDPENPITLKKFTDNSIYTCEDTGDGGYHENATTTNTAGKVFFEEAQWCGAYHQELAMEVEDQYPDPISPMDLHNPLPLAMFTSFSCPELISGSVSVSGNCSDPNWVQYNLDGDTSYEMATRLVGYDDTTSDETAGDGIIKADRFIRESIVGADDNNDGIPEGNIATSTDSVNFKETIIYTGLSTNSDSFTDTVSTSTSALFKISPEYTNAVINTTGGIIAYLPVGLAQSAGAEGYIFGGYNRFGHSNKVYSASGGSTAVATMPVGVSGSSAVYSSFNNKIYLFGGFDSFQSYNTIWEFNLSDKTMRTMSARLPEGVAGISAAYYPPTKKIYLFGGTANNEPQSWVLEYNPSTDSLVTKNTVLPIPLTHATAAAAAKQSGEQRVFIFGGFTENGSSSPGIFEYDPTTVADGSALVQKPASIESRGFLTSSVNSNIITLIGGQSEYGLLTRVETYNAQTDSLSSSFLSASLSKGGNGGNTGGTPLSAGGIVSAADGTTNAKIFPQGDIYHIPAAIYNNLITIPFWEKYFSPTFEGGSAVLLNTRDGYSYDDFTGTLGNTDLGSSTNKDANLVWLAPPFYPELLEKVQELMEKSRVIGGYNYPASGAKNYQSGLADQLGSVPDDNPYDNNPSNPAYNDLYNLSTGLLTQEGYKGSVTDVLTRYTDLTQTYQTLFGGLTDENALEGVDKDLTILSPAETNIKLALIGSRCPALAPSATSTPDLIAKCPQFGDEYNMARRFIFEPDDVGANPTGITTGFATNPFTGQKSSALAGILNLDEMATQLQSLPPDKNIIKLIRLRQILEQLQVEPQPIQHPGKADVFITPEPLSGVDLIQFSLPGYENIQTYLNDVATKNLGIQTLIEAYGYTNAKDAYPEISTHIDAIFDGILTQITDDLKETFLKRIEEQLENAKLIAQYRLRRFLEYVKDLNPVVKLEMTTQRGSQLAGIGADILQISETSSVLRVDAKDMFLNSGQVLNKLLSRSPLRLTDTERNGIIGSAIYKIKSFAQFMGTDTTTSEFSTLISQYYTSGGGSTEEQEADLDQRVKNVMKDVYMYYGGIYDQTDETLSDADRAIASAYCGYDEVEEYYCDLTTEARLYKDARTKLEELQDDFSLMMEEVSKVSEEFQALFSSITMEKQSLDDLMKLLTTLYDDYDQANECVGITLSNTWSLSSSLIEILNGAVGGDFAATLTIATGAAAGATYGLSFGAIGAGVGAIIGALVGWAASSFGSCWFGCSNNDAADRAKAEAEKQRKLCREGITNYNKHLGQLADQFLCNKTNPKYEDE